MENRNLREVPNPAQSTSEVLKRAKEFSFPNAATQVKNLEFKVREEELRILRQDLEDLQAQLVHLTDWPDVGDDGVMRSQYGTIIFESSSSDGLLITRSGTLLFDSRLFSEKGRIRTASLEAALNRFGLEAIRDGLARLFLRKLNQIESRKSSTLSRLRQLRATGYDL